MTTLITGAGMVGSLAAARLVAEYGERPVLYDVAFTLDSLAKRIPLDQVTLVRGDVTDLPDLIRAIQTHNVERIIHTAAMHTATVRQRPYAGVRINLMGTLGVLEAARLTGIKRVVYCSSSTVYLGLKAAPPEGIFKEDFAMRTVSERPPSLYASMKIAAEWAGQSYCQECGVDFVATRFAGIFGPWEGPLSTPSKRIKELIEGALGGRRCRISSGDTNRGGGDYVYAADAAQGAVRAVFAPNPTNRVYNISMGRLYAIPDIVEAIERVSGRKVELDVYEGGNLSGYDDKTYPTDISHSQAELGYGVEFPMEEAIRDYIEALNRNI